MEGEDTVAFLDHQAPLLFRCSRQVPLMSASFGEVGGRGFMRVAWEWRGRLRCVAGALGRGVGRSLSG